MVPPPRASATRTTRYRSSTERIAIGYSITLSFSIRPAALRGRAPLLDTSIRCAKGYRAAMRQKSAPPDQHDVSEHVRHRNHRHRPNALQGFRRHSDHSVDELDPGHYQRILIARARTPILRLLVHRLPEMRRVTGMPKAARNHSLT
jgi:hypothetical protein